MGFFVVLFEDGVISDPGCGCGWMGRGKEKGGVREHDSQVYQAEHVPEGSPGAGRGCVCVVCLQTPPLPGNTPKILGRQ